MRCNDGKGKEGNHVTGSADEPGHSGAKEKVDHEPGGVAGTQLFYPDQSDSQTAQTGKEVGNPKPQGIMQVLFQASQHQVDMVAGSIKKPAGFIVPVDPLILQKLKGITCYLIIDKTIKTKPKGHQSQRNQAADDLPGTGRNQTVAGGDG